MHRETKDERRAWSKHFGLEVKEASKYANERAGKYQSKHEAEVAANLAALEKSGQISNLREQVSFILIEGRNGIRPVKYIADFTFIENDKLKIADAKGFSKNAVYRLKKKMMKLLLGLDIEEL